MYICVHICIHLYTYVPLKAGVQLQFTTLFQKKTPILCSHFSLPLFTAHKTDQKGTESNRTITPITLKGNSCKSWLRYTGGNVTLCTAVSHFVFVL